MTEPWWRVEKPSIRSMMVEENAELDALERGDAVVTTFATDTYWEGEVIVLQERAFHPKREVVALVVEETEQRGGMRGRKFTQKVTFRRLGDAYEAWAEGLKLVTPCVACDEGIARGVGIVTSKVGEVTVVYACTHKRAGTLRVFVAQEVLAAHKAGKAMSTELALSERKNEEGGL